MKVSKDHLKSLGYHRVIYLLLETLLPRHLIHSDNIVSSVKTVLAKRLGHKSKMIGTS